MMITLEKITKSVSPGFALKDISLEVAKGSTLALFGPSGCGKTTTLRLIAGFERPDSGYIHIESKFASNPRRMVAPHRRNVGMVFQDLALWPHMTVGAHLDFVMDGRIKERTLKKRKIRQMLEKVELVDKAAAYPHQLSGGERQRLAMARALVVEPAVMLMDEPLASLDAHLRSTLLRETRTLIQDMKMTTVYVTHAWNEALYLANRIAFMNDGRISKIMTQGIARKYNDQAVALINR
ncbi:hypothetical protein D1BOALGB6SA_7544 [Olavius sp. associated proteobacterium Delta 1]|nr:hypothetical protein D1BOALGB6SA_7544 [Olavius sp. associated proteobacterium Delta 1]